MDFLEDALLISHGDGSLADCSVATEHQLHRLLRRRRLGQHLNVLILCLGFGLTLRTPHQIIMITHPPITSPKTADCPSHCPRPPQPRQPLHGVLGEAGEYKKVELLGLEPRTFCV